MEQTHWDAPGDWRNEAVNAALATEARKGSSEDTVLREIRRHRPGAFTRMTWLDRLILRRFLDAQTPGWRSLLPGGDSYHSHDGENEKRPYTGWYAAEWQGATVEIALVPNWNRDGYLVCASDHDAALADFVTRLSDFSRRPAGRCLRYTEGWESAPDLDAEIGKVTWENIVLPAKTLSDVRDAVEGFFAHRETYHALGFAWKRGVLLVGPPGTGKTMICKAAAAALPDLPFLYVRDLREYDQQEALQAIFQRARSLAPCILAFEDVEGMVTEDNRTVFLNEMDGFGSNDGLLVIASSNHPHKIDEALLKRPSRFDRVFHIGLPGKAERKEFCRRVLTRSGLSARLSAALDIDALAEQVAEQSDGFTPAYLKEAVIGAALQRAQDGASVLDERFADAVLAQVAELRHHLSRMKDPDFLAEMRTGSNGIGFRAKRD